MQLAWRIAAATAAGIVCSAAALAPAAAAALSRPEIAGELRFNYYYELSTLVYEPMASLDAVVASPAGKSAVGVDYALDAVTSASLAFGAKEDELIYELRNEVAFSASHDFGALALGASYRFSKECVYDPKSCDYTAHAAGAFGELALLEENLVLRAMLSYGYDRAFRRFGALEGDLRTYYAGLAATWLVDPRTILRFGWDLMDQEGFQSNIYRRVTVAGIPREESHPDSRWRHTLSLALKHRFPELGATADIEYRWYHDTWKITGQDVGIRTYFDLGRWAELRLGYRLYAQNGAYFWKPAYSAMEDRFLTEFTGDPKLGRFRSHLFGARLEIDLSGLDGLPVLGALRWIDIRYDYLVQNNAYRNAHLLGASVAFEF